jgi:hypothetical protein
MLVPKYMLLAGAVALFAVAIGMIASIFCSQHGSPHRPEGKRDQTLPQRRKNMLFCRRRSA